MKPNYESRLGKFVGLEEPATLVFRMFQWADLTATRLRWKQSASGTPSRMERSNGYLVCLQRRSLEPSPYWVDGRATHMDGLKGGQFFLLDMNQEHASVQQGAVDCVSVLVSRDTLNRYCEEHDLATSADLRAVGGKAYEDHVVRNLGECLLPAFQRPEAVNQLFVDHISLALLSHLATFYSVRDLPLRPARGALAPYQERRAKEMLLEHLNGGISLEELATACGLSRSHFARAFRMTTGLSPLRWLLGQRLERASSLLLESDMPIDLVAQECGFADQSHLTRVFTKAKGVAPGRWRREHRL